jgi:hypothetical protein
MTQAKILRPIDINALPEELVESTEGITPRASLLDPYVRAFHAYGSRNF